ncbi:cupredoxin domain-containing protein [Solirubrobacter sp. CPCC 204708]|uniref:Cupredoxin domain-containing protein n=1 Tax=Solirubrobacter deserti TaxID=2282478 RepID=A0ABT4RER1_9ACTN|nr:cupredoxin domain-containing protein [Solirubrobacter deserti]MBE2318567.1 cupredoxin domain-containing protein [Solirubrobacter deserti]MDA0137025.1 cupredoxin domain-containing protein [Solirubrobacter deserti]
MLVAIALTLAGCGDGGEPVRERGTSFTVAVDDYLVRPQQLRVPKGKRLTMTVINRGRLGHSLRIRGASRNILAFDFTRPGASETRTFKPGPGTYTIYCVLANHEELGLNGSLKVG